MDIVVLNIVYQDGSLHLVHKNFTQFKKKSLRQ